MVEIMPSFVKGKFLWFEAIYFSLPFVKGQILGISLQSGQYSAVVNNEFEKVNFNEEFFSFA